MRPLAIRRSSAQVLLVFHTLGQLCANTGGSALLGMLLPLTGDDCVIGMHGLLAAEVAVDLLAGTGGYVESVSLALNDTRSIAPTALKAVSWMSHNGVDGIVACTEARTTALVAKFAAYGSVPMALARYTPMTLELYNQRLATQVVQIAPEQQMLVKAGLAFLGQQRWEHATVFVFNDLNSPRILATLNKLAPSTLKLTVVLYDATEHSIREQVSRAKRSSRRVALLLTTQSANRLLAEAERQGMVGTGWVWIGPEECAWNGAQHLGLDPHDGTGRAWQGLVALRPKGNTKLLLQLANVTSFVQRHHELVAGCPAAFDGRASSSLHPAAAYTADAVIALLLGLNSSSGGGAMWRIKAVDYAGGFTGRMRFSQATGQRSDATGQHTDAIVELVNWQEKLRGGETQLAVVPVALWSASDGLRQINGDRMGGAAGHTSNKPFGSVEWMGGGHSIPSDRTPHTSHAEAAYMAVALLLIMLSFALNHMMYHDAHFFYVPEPAMMIISGACGAGMVRIWGRLIADDNNVTQELEATMMRGQSRLFALALLPIIIFNLGFTVRKGLLRQNVGPILLYSLIGTCISILVVALPLSALSSAGSDVLPFTLTLAESLAFGTLLSAVDPVATATIFNTFGVEANLRIKVLGESIMNTVVCTVLFNIFCGYFTQPVTVQNVVLSVLTAITVPLWSASIGILLGMVAALLYKHAVYLREHRHGVDDETVAHASSETSLNSESDIKQIWALVDSDNDNELSKDEVAVVAAELGFSMTEAEIMDALTDIEHSDADDKIHWDEFQRWWLADHKGESAADKLFRELREFQHSHRSGALSSSASMGIFVLFAYSGYELTEAMLGSGIISVLCCGLCMAHYAFRNLNEPAQRNIYKTTGMLSSIANAVICFLVGQNIIFFFTTDNFVVILLILALCFFGRAINIFGLSAVWNNLMGSKEKQKVRTANQAMLVHSGVRGSISFWLALSFPSHHQAAIVDITMWICVITVVVLGGSTVPVMQRLGIRRGELMWGSRINGATGSGSGFVAALRRFEKNILQPALTVRDEDEDGGNGGLSPNSFANGAGTFETELKNESEESMFESDLRKSKDDANLDVDYTDRAASASAVSMLDRNSDSSLHGRLSISSNKSDIGPIRESLELHGSVGANDQKWSEMALDMKPSQRRRLSIELGSGVGHVFDYQTKKSSGDVGGANTRTQQRVFTKVMAHLRRKESSDSAGGNVGSEMCVAMEVEGADNPVQNSE